MGFRFRKSIKLAPGVKLNLNKKSVGVTFGKKGVHHTINSSGRKTTSVSLPGTGLSYVHTSGSGKKNKKTDKTLTTDNDRNTGLDKEKNKGCAKGCLSVLVVFFVLVSILGSCGDKKKKEDKTTIEKQTSTEAVTTTEVSTTALETTTEAINPITEENTTVVNTESVTEASSEVTTETNEQMVWICSEGKKYHKSSTCSSMDSPWEVTVSDAERLGYSPCKRCY